MAKITLQKKRHARLEEGVQHYQPEPRNLEQPMLDIGELLPIEGVSWGIPLRHRGKREKLAHHHGYTSRVNPGPGMTAH